MTKLEDHQDNCQKDGKKEYAVCSLFFENNLSVKIKKFGKKSAKIFIKTREYRVYIIIIVDLALSVLGYLTVIFSA